ncbi:hypothetical protein N7509_000116 [Penicillium cosmopolitanum]|uniref:Phosphatidylglycerol/phosphatidylinositol transfer protein n=1 Tax=Penicillium cosmopolitanum TaxID=1131564 RepID=A0A9W9WD56_9EURO|nr:uncharacterized protein N7509_000116 [Penicillium cosmopolitanum]KAJ5415018.1 hypothetical protein N7509_000116 [Penicillium cosmopolitanum]
MSAPYAWGKDIAFKTNCGGNVLNLTTGTGNITSVDVVPCSEEPCQLQKGKEAHITLRGVAKEAIQEGRIDTTMSVLGIQVPVPNVERDICKTVSKCPIMAEQPIVADLVVPVSPIAPVAKTTITVTVSSQDGLVFCVQFPVFLE